MKENKSGRQLAIEKLILIFIEMETVTHVTQNWLTQKPRPIAFNITTLITFLLLTSGSIFLRGFFHANDWMPASAQRVFADHQYWRLWTTLFAHGDLGHLMNNALMFLPLTYLLTSYFSFFLYPFLGILLGGLINVVVLKTMPLETSIIGMSGVVYWMGGVWLTLFALIDTRKTARRRFAIALFLSVLLFAPQNYEVGISYLSHFLGYFMGITTGFIYYLVNRKKFLAVEIRETIFENEPEYLISKQDDVPHQEPETSAVQCPL